jgi:hypothetical protein
MKRQKIFISGDIFGKGKQPIADKFEVAEIELANNGFEPVNFFKQVDHEPYWDSVEWRKYRMKLLMDCDGIYMLSNWMDSDAARLERTTAIALNYLIIHQPKH